MIPNPNPNLYAEFERTVDVEGGKQTLLVRLPVLGFNPGAGEPLVLTNGDNPRLMPASAMTMQRSDGSPGYTYRIVDTLGDDVVAYLPGAVPIEVEEDGEVVVRVPSGWTVHRDGTVRSISLHKPGGERRTVERDPAGDIVAVTEEPA